MRRSAWWVNNRWWIARIAVLPLHLLVFAVVTFFLIRAIPGDPVLTVSDGDITPEQYAQVRASLGLDGSIFEQLARHIGNVLTLNLGDSLVSGRSLWEEFAYRMPFTLELVAIAIVSALLFSLAASWVIVFRPRNVIGRVLEGYARTAGAVPEFVWAVAAIFVFYATLRWAPAPLGRVDSDLSLPVPATGFPMLDAILRGQGDVAWSIAQHLVLPVIVLTIAQSAIVIKILIASLRDSIAAPPTLFRVASGAGRGTVILSAYRRAAPPAVTVIGLVVGNLIGGAVVIEGVFGIGGMGQYAVDAINANDVVAIQGFLIVVSVFTIGVFFVVDIVNMLLDERRRPGAGVAP
ncbi:MAG: ABC transporter permease [Microbacterium sp.]|uniref:ABC transporter permease n=1 Tax=Microbacterium sp. TaxID=51671 RepID=UPI0027168C33|nr:ABC transporter permease [Microbacterium sp.]MDO8382840.1 ABC transporter permease [Microbacterium sp.]